MIEHDCGDLCFACRLTGLGFDDEQQQIVIRLMQQARLDGVAWMIRRLRLELDPFALIVAGASELTPATLNRCMEQAMRYQTWPMSAEVAAHRGQQ